MQILTLKEVDSTNFYAKNNLEALSDKTIIQALRQTFGHGRFSRKWIDLGGENLYLSFVLKPSTDFLESYSNLTQYLSVVLCEVLENYGLIPSIKWPNDVLINDKKIAGILSETVMQGTELKGLILGIGVNLNVDKKDIKKVTDKVITALNLEINEKVDLQNFTKDLVAKFFEKYDEFLLNGFRIIKQDYLNYANFLNENVKVETINGTVSGIAASITDCGELVLKNNEKDLVLTSGDIFIIERE